MRKGEKDMGDDISFDGVDGLKSPEFLQAIRSKAFSENKSDDTKYMVGLASLSLGGPALEWFEYQDNDVQTDWTLFRRALLEQFPASTSIRGEKTSKPLTFSGGTREDRVEFIQAVRKHAHAEGKFEDDRWTAAYAASCMGGEALTWHVKLDAYTQNSWAKLERALLTSFPGLPPPVLPTAGRVLLKGWENQKATSLLDKETWLREARARRVAYDQARPIDRLSVYWILVEEGGNIPDFAIQAGVETNGYALYCARTWHQGGLHPGKIVRRNDLRDPFIPFAGGEHRMRQPYEILVGDKEAVRWVDNPPTAGGTGKASPLGVKEIYAVEGGVNIDGSLFLLGQAFRDDCGWHPGKVSKGGRGCEIPWCGRAHFVHSHKILVWVE